MASSFTQKKPSKDNDSSKGAYDAIGAVDELVRKPVLGSDGAASWQQFRQTNVHARKYHLSRPSVAPTAPVKPTASFKSWQEEREYESNERKTSGAAPLYAGYTTFKDTKQAVAEEAARKKRAKQIEERRRPDDVPYFLSAETFQGWKFDYVFTTRDRSTGYYWDGMDSVKKLRGELKEPPAVEGSTTSTRNSTRSKRETPSTDDLDDSTPKKKKKMRKKVLEGPVIVDDPNNPLEQVAAALQKKNQRETTNLPPGWETAVDSTSKKTYYYNVQTGERAWERPGNGVPRLPEGWSAARDPTSGKEYYYHAATKETRWEKPI